jgi:hypothetical protein
MAFRVSFPPPPPPPLLSAAHGVENAEVTIPLRIAGLNVPPDLNGKYPHLYGCTHLQLDEKDLRQVGTWRGQERRGQGGNGGGGWRYWYHGHYTVTARRPLGGRKSSSADVSRGLFTVHCEKHAKLLAPPLTLPRLAPCPVPHAPRSPILFKASWP